MPPPSLPRRSSRCSALVVGLAFIAAACSGGSSSADTEQGDGSVAVVATTTILGDVVRNVLGPYGTVEDLVPLGADPHDHQASAQQVAAIQSADLVVANGLLLEEGLTDVLATAQSDGANVLTVGPLLEPLPFGDPAGGGEDDPHVWFDPVRMAAATRLIGAELTKVDDSIDWTARAAAYAEELLATDARIVAILEPIPPADRKLVTNHDALGYFADRYAFEIIGAVVPGGSTLGDPSSAELADLVAEVTAAQVPAIFAETTEPTALAEAVAAEVGDDVEVVELYTGSLGEPGSGAESLIGMLLTNAERIAGALA